MSKIQLFINQAFLFYRRDFYILIASNIVLGVLLKVLTVHAFLEGMTILFMFFKNFTFVRSASIMPSISNDFDRFSWKYFQGLPLNKKEIILSLVLSNFMVMLPLLVFVIMFSSQIGDFFSDEGEILSLETKVKFLIITLPVLMIISFSSIRNLITFPRTQYSRVDSKINLYLTVKYMAIGFTGMFYGSYILSFIVEYTGDKFLREIWEALINVYKILGSWWLVPAVILMTVLSYKRAIKAWQDEKIGYIKNNWKTTRDVSIIATSICLNLGLSYHLQIGIPEDYQGTPLLRSVYSRDLKEVKELLKEGHDVNEANDYGNSPLMVAAFTGNFNLFQLLLEHKASLSGEVKKGYKKGMNLFQLSVHGANKDLVKFLLAKGFNPDDLNKINKNSALHVAARDCDTKMVDYLIKKKAKIHLKNEEGQTPLHLAAKRRCFGTIVSLIESGADPLAKDKEGKLALDYIEKDRYRSKELAYYLEKRSRAPAGK